MRAFSQAFPIWDAVRSELNCNHCRILARMDSEMARPVVFGTSGCLPASTSWSCRRKRNCAPKWIVSAKFWSKCREIPVPHRHPRPLDQHLRISQQRSSVAHFEPRPQISAPLTSMDDH